MKTICILLGILAMNILNAQESIPSLTIQADEIKIISPRTYKYDTLKVSNGGILKFQENSSQWAIIECNVLIVDGIIEFTNFRRELGLVRGSLNGNERFEYEFPKKSFGGAGSGGRTVHDGTPRAGKGHIPNDANGGGGGSGAWFSVTASGKKTKLQGNDADSYRGALFPSNGQKHGGDGGVLSDSPNGGLIFIKTKTASFGPNAYINLNGIKGKDGEVGKKGHADSYRQSGSSGNGGGSAGGDGGVLILHFETINQYPNVETLGGDGGKGAVAPSKHRTDPGENGKRGRNGYHDFIQIN